VKYCSECGGPVVSRIPEGDSFSRQVCEACGRIFYRNPKIVVGTLPRAGEKILLCKRAIEPRRGYWTLPSGYLELGETVQEGALRETVEEAGAQVHIERLYAVFSLPHVSQVYLIFLADLESEPMSPGHETLEVRLFSEMEIPWAEIAFRAIEFALERYFRSSETSGVHVGSYRRESQGTWIKGHPD
jgi:ADP-ribose pyrophosphatase YjhB (NUDIX family)